MKTLLNLILRIFRRRSAPVKDPWNNLRKAAPTGVRDISILPFLDDDSLRGRPVLLFKPPKSDFPVAAPLPSASLSEKGWASWWTKLLEELEEDGAMERATLTWLRAQPDYLDGRVAILLAAYEGLKAAGVDTYGLEIKDGDDGHFTIGGEHLDGPEARGAMTRGKPGDTNKNPVNSKRYPAGDREFFNEWARNIKAAVGKAIAAERKEIV